jgi:hypothetical protein
MVFYLLEGLLLTIILIHVTATRDDDPNAVANSNLHSESFVGGQTGYGAYATDVMVQSAGALGLDISLLSTNSTASINATNAAMMPWLANFAVDILLVLIFFVYCRSVHKQSGTAVPRFWLCPQDSFVLFPGWLGMDSSECIT